MCASGTTMGASALVAEAPLAGRLARLAAMPARLHAVMEALPRERWRARPAGGGFALVEHVCHLRDLDGDGYRTRLERMQSEEEPALPDIDGDALAAARDYLQQDLEAAFAAFLANRLEIVRRLAGLTSRERRRAGILEGVGQIDAEGLVGAMLGHDAAHHEELTALCRELGAA
jgi:DinB superfamily